MVGTAQHDYRKYLDPNVLAKIDGLELRARLIVEGFYSGMHHSPHHGVSVEFADHRAYTQGDDLRHIDWKVFAKTDKYYIKQYEQETNLNLMIVVDASGSMNYRSEGSAMTKYEYASTIASAIAYLTLQQQDSVGLARFDERVTDFIRPSNAAHHWKSLVQELSHPAGETQTSIGHVLGELAERLTGRMLILIISDLFDDPKDIFRGLKQLRYRRHELMVWNIWDQAELTFPFERPVLFEGLESLGKLMADPRALRNRYLEEVAAFQSKLRTGCGHLNAEFSLFDTSVSMDVALSEYLATRSARLRQRSSRIMGGS